MTIEQAHQIENNEDIQNDMDVLQNALNQTGTHNLDNQDYAREVGDELNSDNELNQIIEQEEKNNNRSVNSDYTENIKNSENNENSENNKELENMKSELINDRPRKEKEINILTLEEIKNIITLKELGINGFNSNIIDKIKEINLNPQVKENLKILRNFGYNIQYREINQITSTYIPIETLNRIRKLCKLNNLDINEELPKDEINELLDITDFEMDMLEVESGNIYEGYEYTQETIELHQFYTKGIIIESIQKSVQDKIKENREITANEIFPQIRSDLLTLSLRERLNIIKLINKLVKKFNIVHSYIENINNGREPYSTPKKLLCAMYGIEDKGIINTISDNIKIKQNGPGIEFTTDRNTFKILYNYKKDEKESTFGVTGFYKPYLSKIPDLEGTLTIIKGNTIGTEKTRIHEGQHNWNKYFMTEEITDPLQLERAKDEIIAYLREGVGPDSIEDTLTDKNGPYTYGLEGDKLEQHVQNVKNTLGYVKEIYYKIKGSNKISMDNIISALSCTPITKRKDISKIIKNEIDNYDTRNRIQKLNGDHIIIKGILRRDGSESIENEIKVLKECTSIDELQKILKDPKYSHIEREPDNKSGIEISATIDEIVGGNNELINDIPIEIRDIIKTLTQNLPTNN